MNVRPAPLVMPLLLVGCGGGLPPLPQATFNAAAKACHLKATTYTPEWWMGEEEPLVDFTGEEDWRSAEKCFDAALDKFIPDQGGYHWATLPAKDPAN